MELGEEVARRLRPRQAVPQQGRQCRVAAQPVQILRPLAARRPQRQHALDHLRGAKAALALLDLNLPVNHRRRTRLPKGLDQPRHPGVGRQQPGLQPVLDLEIQPPSAHRSPPLAHEPSG